MKYLILYYLLTNNTENNNNEEADQVLEYEERLHIMQLQFTSPSQELIVKLDNFAKETLFQANNNSILCDIFALTPIAGRAVFIAVYYYPAKGFTNQRNNIILRNRLTFH